MNCIKLACIVIFLASCKKEVDPKTIDEEKARVVLNSVIDTMEMHAVIRAAIDWRAFRENVLLLVDKDRGYEGNIGAGIQRALDLLVDNHSSFRYSNGAEVWGTPTISCSDTLPAPVPFDSTVGYIKLLRILNPSSAESEEYYKAINDEIRRQDKQVLKGWIVDLRENRGGSFYPMFRAIVPLLGEGICMTWFRADTLFGITTVDPYLLTLSYELLKPNPKLAILTSRATASSGEAAALCFKGRPNTRSFGNPTCGVSTERIGYAISDLGVLNLAAGIMADRNKNLYGKEIIPDELEPSSALAVQKAMNWLKQ